MSEYKVIKINDRDIADQKTIIYQGTSKEAINPNNPLKSSGFGDDWLQNAKLMNN